MKPGDMIEWRYRSDNKPVIEIELLWSSVEDRYIHIGEKALLVSLANNVLTCLQLKGLFRVHINDMDNDKNVARYWPDVVIPYTCG